ncbi:MAG TPA: hypothetical protein VFP92_10460 [Rhodanobacteraceae bacterium]|nr:hypothetical protein [Rhodanobacteraceae bacterium]
MPRDIAQEHRGLSPLRTLCGRLKVPAEYAEIAALTCRHHLDAHRASELKSSTVLELLEAFDVFRRPERLEPFLITCEADKRGRLGHADDAYPQADFLRAARDSARAVTAQPFVEQGLQGTAIGEAMRRARIAAIGALPRE